MDEIPQDVWPLIISHLEDKAKRQMRLASTKWFNLIRYNNFNLYFTKIEDIPTITERLAKYSWPIKLGFKKCKIPIEPILRLDGQELINHLTKLTNLTKIAYKDHRNFLLITSDPSAWMRLSVLTNIEEWDFCNPYVPLKLWSNFRKLTSWNYHKKLQREQMQPVLQRMTNLTSLSLETIDCLPFTLLEYPERLTSLTLCHKREYKDVELPAVWSRLANLKSLNIIDWPTNTLDALYYLTALETADFNCITLPNLYANTKLTQLRLNCQIWSKDNSMALTNLKCLERVSVYVPEHSNGHSHLEFLLHLTSLNSFSFTNSDRRYLDPSIYQYLPQTLTALDWTFKADVTGLALLTDLKRLVITEYATNLLFLENLSKLTYLSLVLFHRDQEQDLRCIRCLTELQELSLSAHDELFLFTEQDLTPLVNLTKLVWKVEWRDITLNKLTNLEYLECANGIKPLENIEYLSTLTTLIESTRSGTQHDPSFWSSLTRLTALQYLSLDEINDEVISRMTALHHLTTLRVYYQKGFNNYNDVRGEDLTALTTLQTLWLCKEHSGPSAVYSNAELFAKLPYLYDCSTYPFAITVGLPPDLPVTDEQAAENILQMALELDVED